MAVYGWIRLLHVLAAMVWVGAGITVLAFWIRAFRAGHAMSLARDLKVIGPRLGAPASMTALATGIAMVSLQPGLSFTEPWVLVALTIFAISLLIGIAYHGPNYTRLVALADHDGDTADAVSRRLQRTFIVTGIEVALLLLAVLDMTLQPGF